MTKPPTEDSKDRIIQNWVDRFNESLEAGDFAGAATLFAEDGYLRDLAALSWHFHTRKGRSSIGQALQAWSPATSARNFIVASRDITKRKTKVDGSSVIETILDFETNDAHGKAVLRLIEVDEGEFSALVLATALDQLKGHPELIGAARPVGTPSLTSFRERNWSEKREAEQAYADRDPQVLVVGAGQSGLAVAARLRTLGVDTLMVEKLPRVGDVWRNRYHSLTLHNAVWLNHLPYIPFPDTWPVYIPKDKLADWFELYANAMELNVWCSTELTTSVYDHAERRWHAELRRADGTVRVVKPQHIVMATGVSGIPHRPVIPGMDTFKGALIHSAEYEGGSHAVGTKAIVFGSGNSAHDIAQDLHLNGQASVTMVQRSPTTVVDVHTVHEVYDRYSSRLAPDLADLMLISTPYGLALDAFRAMTAIAKTRDAELIADLRAVGFSVDYGDDETGHRMKYLRRGGGYYINVGCSDLIVAGKVGLIQYDQVEKIVPDGVRLVDGTILEADLIALATGYESQTELVRQIFGPAVAERLGPIWGYDDEGELRAMFKRTAQPGLWFHAGGLTQSRVYSRLIALQIKACLENLIDPWHSPDAVEPTPVASLQSL